MQESEQLHACTAELLMEATPTSSELWGLELPLESIRMTRPQSSSLHLCFALDKSKSMGRRFKQVVLPSCAFLHRAMQPDDCATVTFGRTVSSFPASVVEKLGGHKFFESDEVT